MSSPQGNTAREERVTSSRRKSIESNIHVPIGIKTPLEEGKLDNESLFRMNFEILDQIKDNLKNLLMTKKGERLCFLDYGTRLYEVYSSGINQEEAYVFAMDEINVAVSKYIPSISLKNFYSNKLKRGANLNIPSLIDENVKNKKAFDFYNSSNNLNIEKGDMGTKTTNTNNDEIFEIKLEYTVPSISNDIQTLKVLLTTSK